MSSMFPNLLVPFGGVSCLERSFSQAPSDSSATLSSPIDLPSQLRRSDSGYGSSPLALI